jgi:hypothetical protein
MVGLGHGLPTGHVPRASALSLIAILPRLG